MLALDLKLLRDLRRLWAQALAIALVLGCGVAILLTGFGMYRALDATRADYYDTNRFADVFAAVKRAPRTLKDEISAIDGVWAVELRVTGHTLLDLPGRDRIAVGRILSLPPSGEPLLNLPRLVEGRFPDPDADNEVAVNEAFARANGFRPGDGFEANLNGRKRHLTVTGTLRSPEFIYTIGPGGLMPDNEGFGILWMPQAAAEAVFDLAGAFNDVSLRLSRDTDPARAIEALDDLLRPYGGLGAHDRSQQLSHSFVDAEIQQLRSMSYVLPPIFFGIAAFLVNMVLGRIIALERSEIGLLKALGYRDAEVALHYLMLAVLVGSVGVGLGWLVGSLLSRGMARLYAQFFEFPYLVYASSVDAYAVSGLIGLGAAAIGAARSALQAARLAPAIAMQPPAPPDFRHGIVDRVLAALGPSQPTMMILRGVLRWPVRSALTTLGFALGVAVMVAPTFFTDALDEIVELSFYRANRQHATLVLARPVPLSAVEEARRLPGVLAAEPQYDRPVILRNGSREKRVALTAPAAEATLVRVVEREGRAVPIPTGGVLLSETLAAQLGARPGGTVQAEFLDGRREVHDLPVVGIVAQYFGLGAYVHPATLAALDRGDARASAINLLIDPALTSEFHAALKSVPTLAATVMQVDVRNAFQDTLRENVAISTTVYIVVAVLITLGVAYNSARIQLSERARELASLRILGFTRLEVSYILVGETLLLALLAQPLGWGIGTGIAWLLVQGFESDLYRIPLVLTASNFAVASLVGLGGTLGAILIVRRRLDDFDLVSVMKTRE